MRINKTRVYIASTEELKDEQLFRELYRSASPERRSKIDRFIFVKDKRLSLASELLLKRALSDIGICRFTIAYGKYGKPYIDGTNEIFFNLSHSEERAMCTVSSGETGCDTEKVIPTDPEAAKHFFHSSEYRAIAEKSSPEEQCDMFFRLWTLKESFMKAVGLGMTLPLDSFSININGDKISVTQNVSPGRYYFEEIVLGDGYKYSVCSTTPYFEQPQFISLL